MALREAPAPPSPRPPPYEFEGPGHLEWRGLLRDIVGVAGVGLMTLGVYLVFPPAALVFFGLLLTVGAALLSLKERP